MFTNFIQSISYSMFICLLCVNCSSAIYTTKIDGVVCPPNISETVAVRTVKLAHRPLVSSRFIDASMYRDTCHAICIAIQFATIAILAILQHSCLFYLNVSDINCQSAKNYQCRMSSHPQQTTRFMQSAKKYQIMSHVRHQQQMEFQL